MLPMSVFSANNGILLFERKCIKNQHVSIEGTFECTQSRILKYSYDTRKHNNIYGHISISALYFGQNESVTVEHLEDKICALTEQW